MAEQAGPRVVLTFDEAANLANAINQIPHQKSADRDTAVIAALGLHGLRRVEICRLRWSAYSVRGQLHIRTAKGGVNRTVTLAPFARQLMDRALLDHDLFAEQQTFFATSNLKPWAVTHVTRAWQRGQVHHRYPAVNFHALRHTYAMQVWQKTHDVLAVRDALGHRHIRSTEFYLSTIRNAAAQYWQADDPHATAMPTTPMPSPASSSSAASTRKIENDDQKENWL